MIVGILYVSFLLCLICLDIGGCHLGGRGDGVGCGYPLGGGFVVVQNGLRRERVVESAEWDKWRASNCDRWDVIVSVS